MFLSETHYFVIHYRGYDFIVCLDSKYGNHVRIDKPYNVKTLYCTPFEEQESLDIPMNPSQMLVTVSCILDKYLKSN